MRSALFASFLALSACASSPKAPPVVAAPTPTVAAPPIALPNVAVTVLSTRLVPLTRTVVDDMLRLEKDGSLTNIVINEGLGRYRLDARSGDVLVSHVYVRTGITDRAYLVIAKWKADGAEAGERDLENVIQNLVVAP